MAPVNNTWDLLVCIVPCLFCWCEQCIDRQSKKETRVSIKKIKKKSRETLDAQNAIQTYTKLASGLTFLVDQFSFFFFFFFITSAYCIVHET